MLRPFAERDNLASLPATITVCVCISCSSSLILAMLRFVLMGTITDGCVGVTCAWKWSPGILSLLEEKEEKPFETELVIHLSWFSFESCVHPSLRPRFCFRPIDCLSAWLSTYCLCLCFTSIFCRFSCFLNTHRTLCFTRLPYIYIY